jgi:hypothetical protein
MQPNAPVQRRITFDAFTDGWATLTKDIGIYAVSFLLFLIISFAVSWPIDFVVRPPQPTGRDMSEVWAMYQSPLFAANFMLKTIVSALVAPLGIGISRMALMKQRGNPIDIGMMFRLEGKYVQLVIFSFIVAFVGTIGTVLCLIPALIWYGLMLPGGLLVLDKGMLGTEAISTSLKAMMPSLGAAIGIVLMCGLCLIGGALLCCVGVLFLGPVYFCTQAAVYRELFDYGQPGDPTAQPEGSYYRPPQ